MTNFLRYRPVLSGWQGGPGMNTWHGVSDVLPLDSDQGQQFANEIRTVYETLKSRFVSGVTITFPNEITEHNEETGELVAVHAITSPAAVIATASSADGQVPRSTTFVARLNTDTIRDGRRLTGRHFLGPIPEGELGIDGAIATGSRTSVQAAYGGVLDLVGPNLVVWGPPKHDANGNVVAVGKLGRVVSVSVNAIPGTLRSRKT